MHATQGLKSMERSAVNLDVRDQVVTHLTEYFMADFALEETTLLVDDLGADSLDLLHVTQMLNDVFNIDIDVDSLPRMLSVGGVCSVVEQLQRLR